MSLTIEANKLMFPQALTPVQIIGRPNRFIVLAELEDGTAIDCHCAVPGTIGGVVLDGLPGLVSGPYPTAKRSTPYSLEAFNFRLPDDPKSEWIGVNQTAANSYVAKALEAGWLDPIVKPKLVQREQRLGSSRLDFLINGDTWLEVKTPVDNLQIDPPAALPRKWPMASKGMDRAGRQVTDLTLALDAGQRAVVLTLFCYDNDGRWREWPYRQPAAKKGTAKKAKPLSPEEEVLKAVEEKKLSPSGQAFAAARASGLESWRLSFKFHPTHLEFLRLEQVTAW